GRAPVPQGAGLPGDSVAVDCAGERGCEEGGCRGSEGCVAYDGRESLTFNGVPGNVLCHIGGRRVRASAPEGIRFVMSAHRCAALPWGGETEVPQRLKPFHFQRLTTRLKARPFKAQAGSKALKLVRQYLSAYALIFTGLFLTHLPLLRLPYFWDEAGYFIPAARDLLLTGSPIPHTTLSNAHPPLVMLWLAFWWKLSAFTPAVTRISMLLVASFALLGLWRLSRDVANEAVALATVLCAALYPVFFAQSSLAHLDMMAAALTLWGLAMYIERRPMATIVFFALASL